MTNDPFAQIRNEVGSGEIIEWVGKANREYNSTGKREKNRRDTVTVRLQKRANYVKLYVTQCYIDWRRVREEGREADSRLEAAATADTKFGHGE